MKRRCLPLMWFLLILLTLLIGGQAPAQDVAEPLTPTAALPADARFLTLQDAIQTAMRCNPDLRVAEQRAQIADAVLARARAEFYPRLGISEDFAVTNNAA